MASQFLDNQIDAIYRHRVQGLGAIAAAAGPAMQVFCGSWFMMADGTSPALVASVPNGHPVLGLAEAGGHFSLSLIADTQEALALQILNLQEGKGGLSHATWLIAPSGVPCLRGATAIFDCELTATRAAGDSTLLWGRVRAAGGGSASPNLTLDAVGAVAAAGAPLDQDSLPRPQRPLPAARLAERPERAYARRRWGLMAIVSGNPLRWYGAVTSAVTLVSRDPPAFLLLLEPGSRLADTVLDSGQWALGIASDPVLAFLHQNREEASARIEWHQGMPVIPGALAQFAGTVMDHWEVAGRLAVFGEATQYRLDRPDLRNVTGEDLWR
jgi:flavin reductase (DIM6/NTAB) family NADH-FMN oxidoreductase RutF